MLPLLLAHHWVALSQVPRQPGPDSRLWGVAPRSLQIPAGSRPQLPEQGNRDCFTKALTQPFSKESQSEPGLGRFHPSYRSRVRVGGLSPSGAGHAGLAFVSPALGKAPSPRRPGPGPVLTWPVNNSQIRVGRGGDAHRTKGCFLHLTVIRAGEAHKSRRQVTRRGCRQARVSVCVHVCVPAPARLFRGGGGATQPLRT